MPGFGRVYSDAERQDIGAYAISAGVNEAARVYECPKRTVRTFRAQVQAQARGEPPVVGPPRPAQTETQDAIEHELGPDAWAISMRSRTVATYEQLVAACEVNLADWEQVSFRARSYQITTVPRATRPTDREGWVRPDAEPTTTTMYALSAAFKKKVAVIAAREEIAALIADAKTRVARPRLELVPPQSTGYLLEIGPPDAHFNKFAWARETGGADYDLGIAVRTYNQAVETLLARSAHITFERAIYLVGHDILNADNAEGTTTRGTRQDNDTRFIKAFTTTRRTVIANIERVRDLVGAVDVIVIPGNHDTLMAMCLGDAIDCWFHGDPRVSVNVEPAARKYVRWGEVMLGFAHGDRGKPQLWSRLMPVERPDLWGRTRYKEFHVGHLHKESAVADEVNGVKVRVLPSLAPPDAWHAGEGYVGNQSAAQAFWWHKTDGLVGVAQYNHRFDAQQAA